MGSAMFNFDELFEKYKNDDGLSEENPSSKTYCADGKTLGRLYGKPDVSKGEMYPVNDETIIFIDKKMNSMTMALKSSAGVEGEGVKAGDVILNFFNKDQITEAVTKSSREDMKDFEKNFFGNLNDTTQDEPQARPSTEKIFSICGGATGGRKRRSRKYSRKSYRKKKSAKKSNRKTRRY
jgi:hypothetical protein